MRRFFVALAAIATVLAGPAALAQETNFDCGVYREVVCNGFFTDAANIVDDDQRVEEAVDRVVTRYGNQIAVVTVSDSSPESPADFADNLGNEWGVGGPD
ncbi:MAG: TPM domain-containing protein, partial [Acidimicrobiia bacterium]|nr:TPM domain-containing protein [Acidimicrobiia bacterium]